MTGTTLPTIFTIKENDTKKNGRPVIPVRSGYPGTGAIITTRPVVQIQVQEANLPILYVSVQQLYHHIKL